MAQENGFSYTYSAPENQEVLAIRKKYLPREESKLEELKRLDGMVSSAGAVEALCAGIGGCLVFGVAMCFGLDVFGSVFWPAIPLGLLGSAGMVAAYPLQKKRNADARKKYGPRILELAEELIAEK